MQQSSVTPKPYRQLRAAVNRTLESVAEEAGIHAAYLSRIERGLAEPSPLVESRLDAALGQLPLFEPPPAEPLEERLDPRNVLNALTGKQWIQETTTVWRQRGLGANHAETKYEKLHPAPFSFQDVARLIRFFTKPGMLVLDPFVGVGSTLKAAALEGRRGIGIELSEKWAALARQRLREETPDDSQQQIWCMDVREAAAKLAADSVDFIVTSPPYWAILNKRPDHKVKEVRLANGLDRNYSNDVRDLANVPTYEEFIRELVSIFEALAGKLVPGKYCAIIVSDFKHKERYYPYHSDLHQRLHGRELNLEGITILHQTNKALYPYGYPFAYVPNIHHQYILLFRRRSPIAARAPRNGRSRIAVPSQLDERLAALGRIPHKTGEMAGRHWGHQRHSICSFPSKMKPALASVLVDLLTTPQSVVLDPLAGCGTIPFEGALQGRPAIAGDISPLAFVISSAKLNPPTKPDCDAILAQVEEAIRAHPEIGSLDGMEREIQEFYHPRTAHEIEVARATLSKLTDGFTSNAAGIFVTACLAHILHGNRPYALSRRSHNIIPIPPKGPAEYKSVVNSLRDKCARMLDFPLPPSFTPGRCYRAAAHAIPLGRESVDVVITSPPFLGTTHFLRQNRIRNWLVGWNYETQASQREMFLEHKADVSGYAPILRELQRVVRGEGLVVFHVGLVDKENMADMLHPLFIEARFMLEGTVWEDTTGLECHGRTDRGATTRHGFVVYRKR